MKLGEYNIASASVFVAENIDLIEDNNFDELFSRAYKCLLVPDVTYMLYKSDIEFLPFMEFIVTEQFKYCNELESITIPPNIKIIGRDAFIYCKNLKQVNFTDNNNVTVISTDAFANCLSLETVIYNGTLKQFDDAYGNQSWYRRKYTQARNEPKIICSDGIIDLNS